MNYAAVDALIDTMNRQRSVDQFQTRFNVPIQSQVKPLLGAGIIPSVGSTQGLDAAIQSMYLDYSPATVGGAQRFRNMGISPLSMGTFGSNIPQYGQAQRFGSGNLYAGACQGVSCAPGYAPLGWNQTLGNIPTGFGWNQNWINPSTLGSSTLGSTVGCQTGFTGQFVNQPLSQAQGFRPTFHHDILSGQSDLPLKSSCGLPLYQQPTAQSEKILHGLLLDRLESLRAANCVDDVLSLLKGQRSTDQIWNLLASGVAVDPMVVAQAIKLDRTVDIKVAEIIQNICHYRRKNSESVRLSEDFISGKVYDGPIYNSVKEQAKLAAMDVVKNQIIDLYALCGRI
jgi:hypothetical protein